MNARTRGGTTASRAMSMVEVLVAMAVMSAVALLVTASQAAQRQSQEQIRARTLALQLAQSKIDRLLKLSPRADTGTTLGFTVDQLAKGARPQDDISASALGTQIVNPPGDSTFASLGDATSPWNFYAFSFNAYAAVVTGEWPGYKGVLKYQVDIYRAPAPGAAPVRVYRLSTLACVNKNG